MIDDNRSTCWAGFFQKETKKARGFEGTEYGEFPIIDPLQSAIFSLR